MFTLLSTKLQSRDLLARHTPLAGLAALLLAATGLVGCGHRAANESGVVAGEEAGEEAGDEAQAEGTPRACGSRGLAPCAEGEFCLFSLEAECGATDRPGQCEVISQACTREYEPVCGCDGTSYPNACTAHAAGTSVASAGNCERPPVMADPSIACVRTGCGGELCQGANDEPRASICVVRPEHACYRAAACERQASGRCGFTDTAELRACLANPPSI